MIWDITYVYVLEVCIPSERTIHPLSAENDIYLGQA